MQISRRGLSEALVLLTLQVLDDPSQTVSMGGDQHPLSLLDLRSDLLVPEGQRPCNGVLKALTGWKLVVSQVCITTILQT